MIDYKTELAEKLAGLLDGVTSGEVAEMLETPPNAEMGDLSLPCFRLSKRLRQSPQTIAGELHQKLQDEPRLARVEAVGGYLNLFYQPDLFVRETLEMILQAGQRYGAQPLGDGQTVVIDFSSPNIAKPFHVAHLRSTVIGHALHNIFSFLGYQCVGINHLGDWGTQFGKLIVAYERWGSEQAVVEQGIDELLRLYVKFHEVVEQEPALEDQARAWFVKIEQGDATALALWEKFVAISMAEFEKIYATLGVSFDAYTGESFYNDKFEAVISELKEKQLLVEDEGAWIVKLDEEGMPPALMLKSDGSSLYHTRDITALLYRKITYNFVKAIYVTDYAQNLHFKQCFKVIDRMGYDWADQLEHVAFGRVSIEGMGLSTRKGNVLKLEEVLNKSIEKAREIIAERNPGLNHADEVAKQIGVGAIIFNDLKGNRMGDIDFKWKDALNFEGETGPYVQYAHARTCSLIRRASQEKGLVVDTQSLDINTALLQEPAALAVVKTLHLFTERVEQAMHKLEPSLITRYLIDLAQDFNRFYHACHVLVEDVEQSRARLAVVQSVQVTLANGLRLIGLAAPEQI